MTFSPQLEARFDKLLKSYPPGRQRSAMMPMLLYAQDEVGLGHRGADRGGGAARRRAAAAGGGGVSATTRCCTASRWASTTSRSAPTSVACCTGGDELWEHACKKLGIGHKEVTADGQISLEEVECIGRVLLGAGHAGELRLPPQRDAREAGPASGQPEEEAIAHAVQRTQPARNQGADAPLRPAEFGVDRHLSRHRRLQGVSKGAAR